MLNLEFENELKFYNLGTSLVLQLKFKCWAKKTTYDDIIEAKKVYI